MSADPLYNYRFPHRDTHPTNHATHTSSEYGAYIASADYHVIVAELPSSPSSLDNTIVGVGVWYHPTPTSPTTIPAGSDSGSSNRRDIDVVHDEQFTTAMAKAKTKYFDDVYGKRGHLHLHLLCTHPGYVRRGVGRALVGWGIGVASGGAGEGEGKGVGVVSLMASQTGEKLYEGMGFRRLGWVAVGEDTGEEEGLGLEAMVLDLREGGGGGGGEVGGGA